MKLMNAGDGRAVLLLPDGVADVAAASGGAFGPTIGDVLADWSAFRAWAATADLRPDAPTPDAPGAAVPAPGQVFAVGLNYRAHAVESGLAIPEVPLVFTKFPSSVAAPAGELALPTDATDWEVELAVIIGVGGRDIALADALDHVAGYTAAQDYSARDVQMAGGSAPQFSLGKSFAGFLPLGPALVTLDEFADPDDLAVETLIDGETVQSSRTSDLIFSVPTLVSYLSHIVELRPGDVILTGTPAGVGLGMKPPRYLRPGEEVTTRIEGIGELHQVCVAPAAPFVASQLLP